MQPNRPFVPHLMVAPTGAWRSKSDHANLPVTIDAIVSGAFDCWKAGADALHLHVRRKQCDVITVLGQHAPPKNARAEDVALWANELAQHSGHWMVCAFGRTEHAALQAAAAVGAKLRVGFENSLFAPDGTSWANNAESVCALSAALTNSELEERAV